MIRIGKSTDIHRLVPGNNIIIGGVTIPSTVKSVGHSDADCLLHTVAESLIGALSLGDLGKLFPDTDPQYKGINSQELVKEVMYLVRNQGYSVINIDSTVILERPKLQSYIKEMRKIIAELLDIDMQYVSVKATTSEEVGIVGRGEAIIAESVVLVTND
ncbi:MAG: 2-C-methyl-D-erythritol 2,4-cyclodiphosphate synthase [Candidatus Izemoplasma sp.]|nr:2-C-methyl-D-erythritol 2,4-cyclodiphosphate synthase [Candidatus Izemoplasma sp.]